MVMVLSWENDGWEEYFSKKPWSWHVWQKQDTNSSKPITLHFSQALYVISLTKLNGINNHLISSSFESSNPLKVVTNIPRILPSTSNCSKSKAYSTTFTYRIYEALAEGKKRTSYSPSALHFDHYIAGSQNPFVAQLNALFMEIPLSTGYSPKWWQIYLLKK